jgi:hypothetical protein
VREQILCIKIYIMYITWHGLPSTIFAAKRRSNNAQETTGDKTLGCQWLHKNRSRHRHGRDVDSQQPLLERPLRVDYFSTRTKELDSDIYPQCEQLSALNWYSTLPQSPGDPTQFICSRGFGVPRVLIVPMIVAKELIAMAAEPPNATAKSPLR